MASEEAWSERDYAWSPTDLRAQPAGRQGQTAKRRSGRSSARGSAVLDDDELDKTAAYGSNTDPVFPTLTSKRRRHGEKPQCRVPGCDAELSSNFHAKYRICPRHYKVPSIHLDGTSWRFCQQCAKFHMVDCFIGDKRSCNKSLTSHNRRRRGVPRSADGSVASRSRRAGGSSGTSDGSRGGSGSASTQPGHGTEEAGSSGINGSSDAASPPEGDDGPAAMTVVAAATPAGGVPAGESSRASQSPNSSAGASPLQQEQQGQQRQNAPPDLATIPVPPPFAAAAGSHTLDGHSSRSAPLLPWQHLPPLQLPLTGQPQDDELRQFDAVLLGLLLSDSPRILPQQLQQQQQQQQQQHSHAALLDGLDDLLGSPSDPVMLPDPLMELGEGLGLLPDYFPDPFADASTTADSQAVPLPADSHNAASAASNGPPGTSTSSGTGGLASCFPGMPVEAAAATAAALQAAQTAGMPPVPAWQQQLVPAQAAANGALRNGSCSNSVAPGLNGYTSPFQLERVSLKVFGCRPDMLAPDVRFELESLIGQPPVHVDGCLRPGCTFLTLDIRLDRQRAGELFRAPSTGSHSGPAAASPADDHGMQRSSSKQLEDSGGAPADGEGKAGSGSANDAAARAVVLQRLAWQLLHRRSLGDTPSDSPLLVQLNAQQLAAAANGKLLHCLSLPGEPPAAGLPVVPRLTAVSPACLALPPASAGPAECSEPAVLLLTGHGLLHHDGTPGLVLCRQHGKHLPVELWGSASGARGAPSALVVSVVGLRPGCCELEVQRGSVLGSSRPLLVLPSGMEEAAGEVYRLLRDAAAGDSVRGPAAATDTFLRDLGAVVAWVEHQHWQPPHHRTMVADGDSAYCDGVDSDEEDEEERGPGASRRQLACRQVPLMSATLVMQLAQHAAAYSTSCGWEATAAVLESAASAATHAALEAEQATAAVAGTAPSPGWLAGDARLQRDEHALYFDFWAPTWQQQLQREETQPLPPVGPQQAAPGQRRQVASVGSDAAAALELRRQQLAERRCDRETIDGIKAAMDWLVVGEEQAQRPHVLCGWQSAVALLAVLATALLLATMCWR